MYVVYLLHIQFVMIERFYFQLIVMCQFFGAISVGSNLIHNFTAVTFSMKLAFFCEKRLVPWNPWFFLNFNTFTFIYEGFRVLSAAFVQILLFATTCHTSALNSWHVFNVLLTSHHTRSTHLLFIILFHNRQLCVICNSFRELSVKFYTF